MNDANVACCKLGYSGATSAVQSVTYLKCKVSETSLLNCPHEKISPTLCSRSEDVGVISMIWT